MAKVGDTSRTSIKCILEAVLLAADEPVDRAGLAAVFEEAERPGDADIERALAELESDYAERGIELKQVASGYRIQVREETNPWVARLWQERPQRYSRALLETLALIAYRQPITRGEIEEVRGVSVSSNIIRTLQEREWIRVVGHRDVPGKPALFGTTRAFLDYFNLQNLDDLPSLAEIRDMESFEPELDLEPGTPGAETESEAELAADPGADEDADQDPDQDTDEEGAAEDETTADSGVAPAEPRSLH